MTKMMKMTMKMSDHREIPVDTIIWTGYLV